MTDSQDKGQLSETSQMTPDGGADGTPGTEEGTPTATDSSHARPGGMRDCGETGDDARR